MKEFKGVISGWHRDGDVIVGKCAYHRDAVEMSAMAVVHNMVVQGHPMHTSKVHHFIDHGTFALCETKNSFYVLIEPDSCQLSPH